MTAGKLPGKPGLKLQGFGGFFAVAIDASQLGHKNTGKHKDAACISPETHCFTKDNEFSESCKYRFQAEDDCSMGRTRVFLPVYL